MKILLILILVFNLIYIGLGLLSSKRGRNTSFEEQADKKLMKSLGKGKLLRFKKRS